MAPYLDVTQDAALALLPEAYRSVPDLDIHAREAEALVIRYYTRQEKDSLDQRESVDVGLNHRVYLKGYQVEPANVVTADYPNFVLDFQRAVAAVLVHLLNLAKRDPGVLSETDASGKGRTYRPDSVEVYPPRFTSILENYADLEPTWGW